MIIRRVQRHGVITLPKDTRKENGVRVGDLVGIQSENGKIIITVLSTDVYPPAPQKETFSGQLIDLRERRLPREPHMAKPITPSKPSNHAA